MNRFLLIATAISAMLMSVPASAVPLLFSQNPDPFQAFEGTAGNIGFLNVENIGTVSATITGINPSVSPTGGELDDQASNIVLIGPNPTVANPLILVPNSNFNIKFSWDAVDNIKDNDVDFGRWNANFGLDTTAGGQLVFAHLRVNDAPLPSALPLFASALGGLGLLGWRRKRKAQTIS